MSEVTREGIDKMTSVMGKDDKRWATFTVGSVGLTRRRWV
jgi:hypothetical protein